MHTNQTKDTKQSGRSADTQSELGTVGNALSIVGVVVFDHIIVAHSVTGFAVCSVEPINGYTAS